MVLDGVGSLKIGRFTKTGHISRSFMAKLESLDAAQDEGERLFPWLGSNNSDSSGRPSYAMVINITGPWV